MAERHIYNKSNCPWTIQAVTFAGNVWFHGPQGDVENGPFTIQPYATVGIKFTTSRGQMGGTFYVTDQNGVVKEYVYGAGWQTDHPEISRTTKSGDPSVLTYNQPANADINILKCNW